MLQPYNKRAESLDKLDLRAKLIVSMRDFRRQLSPREAIDEKTEVQMLETSMYSKIESRLSYNFLNIDTSCIDTCEGL